jgi:hypothetical protein
VAHPSREATSRVAQSRPAIGGDFRGRLWVDPTTLDPSFDYQWIRESTLGERDEGNLQYAMDVNGFVPVDSKELPGAAGARLPGQKETTEKLIRRGGLILMKRSKEIAQEQEMELQAANEAAVAGVTKDLSGLQDGKYVQQLPGAEVRSSMQTTASGPAAGPRFAE